MPQDERIMSREEVASAREIAELAKKLPEKEKERFYFMMQGAALMSETDPDQPKENADAKG